MNDNKGRTTWSDQRNEKKNNRFLIRTKNKQERTILNLKNDSEQNEKTAHLFL